MKEAMEKVKDALGSDAVILHTKKYREGGFLGYKSKEVIEVTAALEEAEVPKRKPASKKPAEPEKIAPIMPNKVLSQYKTNGTKAGVDLAARDSADTSFVSAPFPTFDMPELSFDKTAIDEEEEIAPPKPRRGRKSSRVIKANAFSLPVDYKDEPEEDSEEMAAEEPKEHDDEVDKIQKLEDELAQMKTLLAQVMSKDKPKDVVTLQEALERQEVTGEIVNDLTAKAGAGDTMVDSLTPEAKKTLTKFLADNINFVPGIDMSGRSSRVVALIGPTGVGKTTTLAKIAAGFVLEHGVKAALITADTYRISAVEQLKTYSDIIGLPLEIVYSPAELRKAIRKHKDKELILIDTAGRSQHNEFQMKELTELLAVNKKIEKHLVISATTKNVDAEDIMEKFSVCNPEYVIYTKTDETSSVGLILNSLYNKDIALSYLANGQSVPDDIVAASPEKSAELLLRV